MREIKFRAWDKIHKCFVIDMSFRVSIENNGTINDTGSIIELNQYTGLKDKNGIEIYEGDICRHGIDVAKIIFWEGSFIFKKYCMHDYALTNFACCRTFEVIGNIYQNQELLN